MIVLTGASGWVGRNALAALEEIIGSVRLRNELYPVSSSTKQIDFRSNHGPITSYTFDTLPTSLRPSMILHAAFLKRSALKKLGIQEYINRNRKIISNLVDLLSKNPYCPIVSISSGAAATCLKRDQSLQDSPYGVLKLEEEAAIKSFAIERRAVVFRVYACTGPFLANDSSYALSSFIKAARNDQKIRIHSSSQVWRSYVHLPELMRLSWQILMDKKDIDFNIIDACKTTEEIQAVAEIVAGFFGSCSIERSKVGPSTSSYYTGNRDRYKRLLTHYDISQQSFSREVEETINGMS